MTNTLFLVDAFAFVYRAYYANPNLTNGAAFFFSRTLINLLEAHKPTHVAVVFDTDGSAHRAKLLPTYKEGRAERPQVLDDQLPLIKRIVQALGCHVVEMPGHEADDLLGSLASAAVRSAAFQQIVIVTPDKDMLQLVNDGLGIKVLNVKENIPLWYDAAGVESRLGVRPSQVVDYLTLVGDTSDAIPGVDGIGEKGAANLLKAWGSLDGLMSNLPRLKPGQRENLQNAMTRIPCSRELATIVTDLPVPDPTTFTYAAPDPGMLRKVFMDLGMPSLAPKDDLDDF